MSLLEELKLGVKRERWKWKCFSLDTRMIGFQTRWYHGWTPFSIQTGGSHRVSWKYFC